MKKLNKAIFTASLGFALFLVALLQASFAMAADKKLQHVTEFSVSFAGIPVGVAEFKLNLIDQTYQLALSGRTIGLTKLLSNGKGTVTSIGTLAKGYVQSQVQQLNYRDSKKKVSSRLVFENSVLVSEKIVPKPKDHPDKIPMYDTDKIGVVDPAGALIIPVGDKHIGNGRKICNRTLSVYDGGARYDIGLRYKREEKLSIKGFSGKIFVCQLRYIPIAGHRPKKNVKYMADNKKMEVAYAQVGNRGIYMPIKITVPTKYGTVVAKATKFSVQ